MAHAARAKRMWRWNSNSRKFCTVDLHPIAAKDGLTLQSPADDPRQDSNCSPRLTTPAGLTEAT
eukprot:12911623-Prorocentrum_lima.AAC.1